MPIEVTGLAELVRTLEEARSRAPHAYQLDGSPVPVGNRAKYLSFRFSTRLGPQGFFSRVRHPRERDRHLPRTRAPRTALGGRA